ncbi:MAG: DNA primase small subunit domain-containing protein [Candidatus Thorarchaeota archaeon]
MSDKTYLKRSFKAYYKEKKSNISNVNLFHHREFGFIPWDKQIMIRHMGFRNPDTFLTYLIENGPRHVYSSGGVYLHPDNLDMNKKKYQGCDLIIDVDVDHFYTPCKDDHDIWICRECNTSGKGMPKKCPKCRKTKFKTLNWICENCLQVAKKEIIKLIYNFLFPDFGIKEEQIKIAFSGHRGYHLKVEDEQIRSLPSEARREIADYISGNNISFEILGLNQVSQTIYGLTKNNLGWAQKITSKIEDILKNTSHTELISKLKNFGIPENRINSFMNYKDDFLDTISNKRNIWSIEGFGLETWKMFLRGIIHEIGVKIDEPVTIDIHRLIRYPGTLHGKTGFKVQELKLLELETFNPLNENNKSLDPIVFHSDIKQKIEIIESKIPATKIKGETFGPYDKGDVVEVPHHIAVFLLCKEVAKFV